MSKIKATTRLIALLGKPIRHSLSPRMHNLSLDKLSEDYVYMCMEVDKSNLGEAIEYLKLFDAKGANITYPNKQEVLKYIDEISQDAKIIGSVNTITIDEDTKKIKGYNTDGRGFVESIEQMGIEYKNKKIVIIGVGGAGRAIAVQLAYQGAGEIVLKDIDIEKMQEVKQVINKHIKTCMVKTVNSEEELKMHLKDAVLLVNATPLGMKGSEDMCAISSADVLNDTSAFVYDIIYEPRETKLIKYAKKNKLKFANGIDMMICQGAISFNIWLGKDMPKDYVKEELFK